MLKFPQYNDRVQYVSAGTPATYDEASGLWIEGAPGAPVDIKGRYVANTGPGQTATVNGERIDYSGLLQMPANAPALPEDTEVTITQKIDGRPDKTFKATVIRFIPDRLHCRAFLK